MITDRMLRVFGIQAVEVLIKEMMSKESSVDGSSSLEIFLNGDMAFESGDDIWTTMAANVAYERIMAGR